MANEEQSGANWFDSVVDNFSTGGKYHNIWEGIEKGGKLLYEKEMNKTQQGEDLTFYEPQYNNNNAMEQFKRLASNPIALIGGGLVLVFAVVSMVRR